MIEPAHHGHLQEVPVTFPQQLLWILDFVHPGHAFAPGFVVRARHRIHGPLRPYVLREAFDRVIARHGALRTTIETSGTMPFQTVHDSACIDMDVVDVHAGDVAEAFFLDHERDDHDVTTVPALWARLGRVSADEHLLSTVAHHAVCDAWSLGLVMDDLALEYGRILDGDAAEPPPAPDYTAYSIAQQSRDDPSLAFRLDYWADHLDGVSPGPVVTDHEREPGGSTAKRVERFVVPGDLTARVAGSVRRTRSTTFMMVVAAYTATLARRYDVRDVIVPTITSSRHRPETAGLVGYLNNAVPLRMTLDADPSLGDVLAVARRETLTALANEVPMVLLMDPVPDLGLLLSDDRFVTAPFQHVPYDLKPVDLGDCRCVPERCDNPPQITTMPVDLVCTMGADEDLLVGDICYTATLFEPDTIRSLASGFVTSLRTLIDDPARRLTEMHLD